MACWKREGKYYREETECYIDFVIIRIPFPQPTRHPRIRDLASQPWGLRGMRAADGCGCYGNEARTKFDSARRCLLCRVVGCVRRFLAGAE